MFYTSIARLLRRAWGGTPYFDDRNPDEIDVRVLSEQAKHSASMLQQFVEELASMGANSESYESQVPVKIKVSGEDYAPPDRLLVNQAADDSLYALEVSNPSSYAVSNATDIVIKNGYAINVFGVANFKVNDRREYHLNAGDTYKQYSIVVDGVYISNTLVVSHEGSMYLGDTLVYENNNWYGGDKVKLETNTDTAKYLKFHFIDLTATAYDSTYDIPIKVVVETGQLRLYIDSSSLTGFTAGNNQVIGHLASAGPRWINLGTCS